MNRISHKPRGFTLIELMVTLAVVAVLAIIAVPNFRDAIHRSAVSSASNALLADLSYARTEAVNRGQAVSVCPSTDGTSCNAGTAFDTGWIIYAYTPGNAKPNTAYDAADGTNLLLRYTQQRQGVSIQAGTGGLILSFDAQGQQMPSASATAQSFVICYRDSGTGAGANTSSVPGTQLNLSTAGSVSTATLTAGATCTPG
ncbi:GspH/FimT family pseudopilin [Dyella sedimenti]|uniref:GspH/FimT family pseudopilin n=1 Tax=Dyella sedimenti TaxID=2919947 RepID=UPI001FAA2CBB|nr:GspH/FimT family pseudopilin [Dyella sedimenti]